jgi:hypothetical protein
MSIDVCAVEKIWLKWGLKPIAFSLHRLPHGGVILLSCSEHKLLRDSICISTTAGHITEAAFEVASIPTIVVGVCGNSDKSVGASSLQVMEELRQNLKELTKIDHTQLILIAEDVNVALEKKDNNKGVNNKPFTAEVLLEILVDNHLVDIGGKIKNKKHTW